jgi:small-conductance mechanosensitive channel
MKEDIAALRHRAFAVKLALRRVAAFYNEMKRARLNEQVPELEYFVAAPHLKILFDELHDVYVRVETSLFEEMVRLSLEAERAVNAYVKTHYDFAPGDDIRMGYPTSESPVRLRVHKVFLQSGTDSDIRVDASFLKVDGSTGSRWDVYMKGPGEFQFEKIQRKETVAR